MTTALRLVRAHDDRLSQPPAVDLLTQWQAYMTAYGCSPSTVGIRFRSIRGLLTHAGLQDPLELTRDHVITWLGRGISPWTRLTYWKAARAFSQWLREFNHDPDSDLTRNIPKPKTPEPLARPIDDMTIERLLALRLSTRAHAYVRLALYQALRVHEIAKIRGEDFDLDSGWLMVKGKGGVTKPIPIHPEIAKLAARMPELGPWFPGHTDTGHVHANGVSSTITNALKQCGSTATAHQLRDTAATRMQRTTRDIRLTQAMLRHRNIGSTMKYTEASNQELQNAVQAMNWTDAAQQEPPRPNALPDLATLTPEQLQDLAAQLLAALGGRS